MDITRNLDFFFLMYYQKFKFFKMSNLSFTFLNKPKKDILE